MSANNNAIQAMIDSGADAQKNMYDVYVVWPWTTDGSETLLSVRASNFNVPQATTGKEERHYHGSTVSVPTAEVTMTREFDLTFRWDASYALWQNFITWHSTTGDPVSGGVSNWATATGSVRVVGLSGTYDATSVSDYTSSETYAITGDDNSQWQFADVWVDEVGQPQFANDSSGHMEYTVKFVFGDIGYPYYNGEGITGTSTGATASS